VQGQDYIVTPPEDFGHCNSASNECLSEHSWNTHWIGHVRDTVGIEVRQDVGGYQEIFNICYAAGLYPCPFGSGSNVLTLQGTLFQHPNSYNVDTILYESVFLTKANVPAISEGRWSLCFVLGCGGNFVAQSLNGACQRGTENSMPSWGSTQAGSVLQQNCFGGGVSCKPGYTPCNGNVCAQLQVDPLNCGACGARCPDTYSCDSATCVAPPPSCSCPDPSTVACGGYTDPCGNYCGGSQCPDYAPFCHSSGGDNPTMGCFDWN